MVFKMTWPFTDRARSSAVYVAIIFSLLLMWSSLKPAWLSGTRLYSTRFTSVQQQRPEVLFITAIYGTYEKTLKQPVRQTIPARFVAFTDRKDLLNSPGWEVYLIKDPVLNQSSASPHGINNLLNNTHPFNKAKFFKLQFHTLGVLQGHRVAIWMDATVRVKNASTATVIKKMIEQDGNNFIVFEHARGGLVSREVDASQFDRYTSTSWGGHVQPFQNTIEQFRHYQALGFRDKWWLNLRDAPVDIAKREQYGLWVTCFIAFDMQKPITRTFLDTWWQQNVEFTTQDQVSFPFVAWKLKVFPFSLPVAGLTGDSQNNILYEKLPHGLHK